MKEHFFKLPQMQVECSYAEPAQEILIVSGGRAPNLDWFNALKVNRNVWCVDHGVDFCYANDIVPDFLIGDFDSASRKAADWSIERGVKIESHEVDKDFTDTQLILNRLPKDSFAVITGAFGGRLDHLYSTLFTCAHSSKKICLADEREAVIFMRSGDEIAITFNNLPSALSLLPMSAACEGVSIDGVHWTLKDVALSQMIPNAISNRVESDVVHVSVKSGVLAIYLYFIGENNAVD